MSRLKWIPLWQRNGRVAVRVLAFQEGGLPEAVVVVCGTSAAMAEEAQHYADCAPKAIDGAGTVLIARAETVHLAAHVYGLAGADLEHTQSLYEVYHSAPEKILQATLEHLLQQTLKSWHQDKRLRVEPHMFETLYRERLGWNAAHTQADFAASLQALVHHLPTLDVVVELTEQTMRVRSAAAVWSYPNPTLALQQPGCLNLYSSAIPRAL